MSSSTGAEAQGRKSKHSQTSGSQSLISLSPTLSELCCQHFNGVLPGKGPVSGGKLVVSKRQRDMSFRFLPTIWTPETQCWGWARAQRCKAPLMGNSWAALSLLYLVQKWYLHPHRASWGAGEPAPRGRAACWGSSDLPWKAESLSTRRWV